MAETHVYLAPTLLGFDRLAGIDYFRHVRKALEGRFKGRQRAVSVHVAEGYPAGSVRHRAEALATLVSQTAGPGDGPIHLLGHSMGGLDARLVVSPGVRLEEPNEAVRERWARRVCSVTTLNSPHCGTPGMTFFATAQGRRLLYVLSAVTLAGLSLGAPPLAAASALVATLRVLRGTGPRRQLEQRIVDRLIDRLQRTLDHEAREKVREWLREVHEDQGAVGQLTPEAMDIFEVSVEDRPGLRYQCVASYAPAPSPLRWLRELRIPWRPFSAALFDLLYEVAARRDPQYPCAPADGGDDVLRAALGELPPPEANDGLVPLRSQLWGELVWAGQADHLDVVGYFHAPPEHKDWLNSGAPFDRACFEEMMDRIVEGMLAGEAAREGAPDQYAV